MKLSFSPGRTFGSRHHPPLILRSSNATSSNHAAFRPPSLNNSSSISSPNRSSLQQQCSSTPVTTQSISQPELLHQNSSPFENPQSFHQNVSNVNCPSSSNNAYLSRSLQHPTCLINGHHHCNVLHQSGSTPNPNNQIQVNSTPSSVQLCESMDSNCSNHGGLVFRGGTVEGTDHQQHLQYQPVKSS